MEIDLTDGSTLWQNGSSLHADGRCREVECQVTYQFCLLWDLLVVEPTSGEIDLAGRPLPARAIHLACAHQALPWLMVALKRELAHSQRPVPVEPMEEVIDVRLLLHPWWARDAGGRARSVRCPVEGPNRSGRCSTMIADSDPAVFDQAGDPVQKVQLGKQESWWNSWGHGWMPGCEDVRVSRSPQAGPSHPDQGVGYPNLLAARIDPGGPCRDLGLYREGPAHVLDLALFHGRLGGLGPSLGLDLYRPIDPGHVLAMHHGIDSGVEMARDHPEMAGDPDPGLLPNRHGRGHAWNHRVDDRHWGEVYLGHRKMPRANCHGNSAACEPNQNLGQKIPSNPESRAWASASALDRSPSVAAPEGRNLARDDPNHGPCHAEMGDHRECRENHGHGHGLVNLGHGLVNLGLGLESRPDHNRVLDHRQSRHEGNRPEREGREAALCRTEDSHRRGHGDRQDDGPQNAEGNGLGG